MVRQARHWLGPEQWLLDPMVWAIGLLFVSFCAYCFSALMVSHHLQKYNTPGSPYVMRPKAFAGITVLRRRLHPVALWEIVRKENDAVLRRWYGAVALSFMMIFVAFFFTALVSMY